MLLSRTVRWSGSHTNSVSCVLSLRQLGLKYSVVWKSESVCFELVMCSKNIYRFRSSTLSWTVKILGVSMHFFSCTIIDYWPCHFVLLLLQRTMLLPFPELKWIRLYRQMCPLPSPRLRDGSSQSSVQAKRT